MPAYSDRHVLLVVVAAFVAGYWIVSFIIKRLRDLRNRPNLNDEIWREQEKAVENRRRKNGSHSGQERESYWKKKGEDIPVRLICFIILTAPILFGCSTAPAHEKLWLPGSHTDAGSEATSPWENNHSASLIEYRIRYMLEADKAVRDLRSDGPVLDETTAHQIGTIEFGLADALNACYEEVIPYLKAAPNPNLLCILLYHHGRYLAGSASEWLARSIETLRQLDPKVTEHVDSLLRRDPHAMLLTIASYGPQSVLARFAEDPREFDALCTAVESGDRIWLKIASELRPFCNAAMGRLLTMSAARALPNAPSNVLNLPDNAFSLSDLCTSPFPENAHDAEMTYLNRAEDALQGMSVPAIEMRRRECLDRIRRLRLDVEQGQQSRELDAPRREQPH